MSSGGKVDEIERIDRSQEFAVAWYRFDAGAVRRYIGRFRADGSPVALYAIPEARGVPRWAGPPLELVAVQFPADSADTTLPGLIDVSAGTLTPLAVPFQGATFKDGVHRIWAVLR